MLQRVEIIGASGVGARRNGDALIKRPREASEREIAYQPAIGQVIIQNKWVSTVRTRARRAGGQVLEERIERCRGSERIAGLVINPKRDVDHLDVMVRAHIALGVRRQTTACALRGINPVKR